MRSQLRVYVVDDSALVRERLQERLADMEGVDLVGQSGRGCEAIAAIQHLAPDVVILDICMAGGNGIEVLSAVKQGAAPPVVIMLTAFAFPQYRSRCLALGADYFFDKTEDDGVFAVLEQLQRGPLRHPDQEK